MESDGDESSAGPADIIGQPSFDDLEYTPEQEKNSSGNDVEDRTTDQESEELLTAWGEHI